MILIPRGGNFAALRHRSRIARGGTPYIWGRCALTRAVYISFVNSFGGNSIGQQADNN